MSSTNLAEVGQLIDIGDSSGGYEDIKAELENTKKQLNEALSEVAVAQVLQENLSSVERQKVVKCTDCLSSANDKNFLDRPGGGVGHHADPPV